MLEIKVLQSKSTKLILTIDPKHVKIQERCSLTIDIFYQEEEILIQRKIINPPFAKRIEINNLESSKLIKIKYTFVNGNSTKTNNLFTFTTINDDGQNNSRRELNEIDEITTKTRPFSSSSRILNKEYHLSNTQEFMKQLGKINKVMTTKQLNRTLLAARNSKNTEDFIKSGYKSLRPQLRQDRLKKTILLSHGLQMADTIYKHSQGKQLFKNDWFMGPFYSYNANQKQMRKKN